MTYCIALNLDSGVVLMSDSRTNAGIDYIMSYSKLRLWKLESINNEKKKQQSLLGLMHAGNLATAQRVASILELEYGLSAKNKETKSSDVLKCTSIVDIAERLGEIVVEVESKILPEHREGNSFDVSLLLSGKIGTERHRTFLIYPQGNFIEATPESPILQLGEVKYGKPILEQVITRASSLSDGVQAALLSMEFTVRSNASVGPPYDLAILDIKKNTWIQRRIKEDDARYSELIRDWNEGTRMLFAKMPEAVNINESEPIDVFLSYSNKDRDLVLPILEKLSNSGLSVWWDYNLIGGKDFRKEILGKLEAAQAVIVIWSESSIESAFVIDEADRARKQDKLIPLKPSYLSVDKIPLGFGQLQTIEINDHETIIRSLAALGIGK